MEIHERIREARERAGLRLEAIAVACDCTAATVRNWESGASSPRLSDAPKLCELLGIDPAWLIFGKKRAA